MAPTRALPKEGSILCSSGENHSEKGAHAPVLVLGQKEDEVYLLLFVVK